MAWSYLTATSISQAQMILHTSVFQVAGITDPHHHIQLIFIFLVEMEFHHFGHASLELLASSDPPASAYQSVGD